MKLDDEDPQVAAARSRAEQLELDAILRQSARVFPEREAVVSARKRFTYRELNQRVDDLSRALRSLEVDPQNTIAIMAENIVEYAEIYLAAVRAGITASGINIRTHPDELTHCLSLCEAEALFFTEPNQSLVEEVRDDLPALEQYVKIGGEDCPDWARSYESFRTSGGPQPPGVEDTEEISNILFTSGTTGKPKAAMISHRAMVFRAVRLAEHLKLDREHAFLCWLPMFHCGGVETMYAYLAEGAKVVMMPEMDIEEMYRLIEAEDITLTMILPGVLQPFITNEKRHDYDLTSMKAISGYANVTDPEQVAELSELCQAHFMDGYGQTETGWNLVHRTFIPPGEAPSSFPKVESGFVDMKLVDEDDNDVEQGEPGELVVRGPSIISGYKDNPEANEELFRNGWLHTGDLLKRNDDGSLVYVGRKKYLIKPGGENVYPAEVEEPLLERPEVEEAIIVGVPDDRWGEAIKAFIVFREGKSLTREELDEYMKQRVPRFKRPRLYEFIDAEDFPRSTSGKVQRTELSEWPLSDEQYVEKG